MLRLLHVFLCTTAPDQSVCQVSTWNNVLKTSVNHDSNQHYPRHMNDARSLCKAFMLLKKKIVCQFYVMLAGAQGSVSLGD